MAGLVPASRKATASAGKTAPADGGDVTSKSEPEDDPPVLMEFLNLTGERICQLVFPADSVPETAKQLKDVVKEHIQERWETQFVQDMISQRPSVFRHRGMKSGQSLALLEDPRTTSEEARTPEEVATSTPGDKFAFAGAFRPLSGGKRFPALFFAGPPNLLGREISCMRMVPVYGLMVWDTAKFEDLACPSHDRSVSCERARSEFLPHLQPKDLICRTGSRGLPASVGIDGLGRPFDHGDKIRLPKSPSSAADFRYSTKNDKPQSHNWTATLFEAAIHGHAVALARPESGHPACFPGPTLEYAYEMDQYKLVRIVPDSELAGGERPKTRGGTKQFLLRLEALGAAGDREKPHVRLVLVSRFRLVGADWEGERVHAIYDVHGNLPGGSSQPILLSCDAVDPRILVVATIPRERNDGRLHRTLPVYWERYLLGDEQDERSGRATDERDSAADDARQPECSLRKWPVLSPTVQHCLNMSAAKHWHGNDGVDTAAARLVRTLYDLEHGSFARHAPPFLTSLYEQMRKRAGGALVRPRGRAIRAAGDALRAVTQRRGRARCRSGLRGRRG